MNKTKMMKENKQRQFYEMKIDEIIGILSKDNPTLILSLEQIKIRMVCLKYIQVYEK
ncbi:hypothetical protein [Mammaliicoccus sciuri]|uniref:hypothetical protein n=1 Tax=Mammaliicoccus sciuri TaxID=1296 RepID=UPI002DB5A467|nr:hypothetical protein [Mammaliicoccus sciuri]MEB7784205.1 hypothetical protein [Mammaliicoccus sciuri]